VQKRRFFRQEASVSDAGRLSPVAVLVVDDFEPFRSFVRSVLTRKPELKVIGEESDGLAAVQKAVELSPDLILLDIGLPTLNGIEAARRIRQLVPKAKILFLTQESSFDGVQEALNLGARGYVVKARAGSELLPAVDAVLNDQQFVSSGLVRHFSADVADAQIPGHLRPKEDLASHRGLGSQETESFLGHEVQLYSDEVVFLDRFERFVAAALTAGNAVIAPPRTGPENRTRPCDRTDAHDITSACGGPATQRFGRHRDASS